MKKLLPIFVILFALVGTRVFAAASLPSNSIWYDPTTAKVGDTITLHALVYNDQETSATVTVAFTNSDNVTIATVTSVVPSQNAKTLSATWTMPAGSTVITGTVTAAVSPSNTSITELLGPLGTMTISPISSTVDISLPSFPGSAWLNNLIATVEAFRIKEATYFADLRDTSKANADIGSVLSTSSSSTTPASAATNGLLGHPSDYFTYLYASALATMFASQVLFYILLLLVVLLLLRFIVNLLF
jgi:hypothetical protein